MIAAASIYAEAAPDDHKIAAYYDKQDAVMLSNDANRITKFFKQNLTADFVAFEALDGAAKGHRRSLAEAIDEWTSFIGEGKYTKYTHTLDHLTVGKTSAKVRVTISLVCRLGDGAHVLKSKSRVEDVWIKMGKDWKMKSSKTLGDSPSVDGKPGGTRTITHISHNGTR